MLQRSIETLLVRTRDCQRAVGRARAPRAGAVFRSGANGRGARHGRALDLPQSASRARGRSRERARPESRLGRSVRAGHGARQTRLDRPRRSSPATPSWPPAIRRERRARMVSSSAASSAPTAGRSCRNAARARSRAPIDTPGRRPIPSSRTSLMTESRYANVENRSAADRGCSQRSSCLSRPTRSSASTRCRRTTSSGTGVTVARSAAARHARTSRSAAARASFVAISTARMRPSSTAVADGHARDRDGAATAARLHLCRQRGDELPRAQPRARLGDARLQETRRGQRQPGDARRARERRRARRCCASSSAAARASSATTTERRSMNARAPLPGESRASLRFVAAAVALRSLAVVRAQVPVLRFQLLRGARRAAGPRVRRRAVARPAQRVAVRPRPPRRDGVLGRRHAELVLRRRDRALARRACVPSYRSRPTSRSRSRRTPAPWTPARFAAFREAGVNRLSIGIQSFRDEQLRALGRVHDAAEARSRSGYGARRRLRQRQHRPDVRPAERRRRRRASRISRARSRSRRRTSLGTS